MAWCYCMDEIAGILEQRNKQVHGGTRKDVLILVSFAYAFLSDIKSVKVCSTSPDASSSATLARWKAPPYDLIKINSDVDVHPGDQSIGTGIIFRDHSGIVLTAFSKRLMGCYTVETTELSKIDVGVSIMECDANPFIHSLEESHPLSPNAHMFSDVKAFLQAANCSSCFFVFCLSNKVTHFLASLTLHSPHNLPEEVERMNLMNSSVPDSTLFNSVKENSIRSFNSAAAFPVDYVEFDVQVTKVDCPVIFDDNFILTKDKVGKPLFRKTKDGRIFEWKVENDDSLCTLEEVFQKVEHSVGFNIELKFDDNVIYKVEELTHVLEAVLKVVNEYALDRPIIFSSFQPDAAQLIGKLQNTHPVYFLTNGGSEVYADVRRNSLDEAIKLCLEGIITRIKESKLRLITYGQLNNVPEVVYMQHLMGVEGVIVDFVQEITEAVSDYIHPAEEGEENSLFEEDKEWRAQVRKKPQFSQRQLSFLLKLIPELIRH
ncbi:Glycerophosphoryl diester phosphodiesterase [Parasponia andersonii]|uniref:glycerophosphodiester phosphodiesterase n=1 Tax=Parasponia andersonii TaxID=3476 RepID=A0A2P5BT16_PARAD|nr:Glycerophosphoryl diester phosphodiesterase [Parasponia andersonii]